MLQMKPQKLLTNVQKLLTKLRLLRLHVQKLLRNAQKCLFLCRVQLADAALVAGRGDAEECVAACGDEVIEMRPQSRERPDREDGHEPAPARQHAQDFEPSPIAFAPRAVRFAPHVHLCGQLARRMWTSAFEHLWLVIVEPFEPTLGVERFNPRTHPTAQGAL